MDLAIEDDVGLPYAAVDIFFTGKSRLLFYKLGKMIQIIDSTTVLFAQEVLSTDSVSRRMKTTGRLGDFFRIGLHLGRLRRGINTSIDPRQTHAMER